LYVRLIAAFPGCFETKSIAVRVLLFPFETKSIAVRVLLFPFNKHLTDRQITYTGKQACLLRSNPVSSLLDITVF
jgi:hypothetical protein